MNNKTYRDAVPFTECICGKEQNPNCRYHASPSVLALIDAKMAAKWLLKEIKRRLNVQRP